jgi:hypothetical protein
MVWLSLLRDCIVPCQQRAPCFTLCPLAVNWVDVLLQFCGSIECRTALQALQQLTVGLHLQAAMDLDVYKLRDWRVRPFGQQTHQQLVIPSCLGHMK